MRKIILILSASEGETYKSFKKRMIRELKVIVPTRKEKITLLLLRKTMQAYFYTGSKGGKK